MSQNYLIMYRPPRDGFAENTTPEESAEVMKHFEYLKQLHAEKIVLFAVELKTPVLELLYWKPRPKRKLKTL